MSNLELWNSVCETDPEMTKRVNQRGGFTAIDSYYTIKRLTEKFGPIGEGWGAHVDYKFHDGFVVCVATFWYAAGEEKYHAPPICTMNKMPDEDAGKKALTDALTKWASYLGFSADVFEGKFDDNRYVESLKAKAKQSASNPKAQPESKPITAYDEKLPPGEVMPIELENDQHGHPDVPEFKKAILKAIDTAETKAVLNAIWSVNKKAMGKVKNLSQSSYDEIYNAFAAHGKQWQ